MPRPQGDCQSRDIVRQQSGRLVPTDFLQLAPFVIVTDMGQRCHSTISRRLIGSREVVRNPSLKSDRDRRRHVTALQGEVAGADQMAHLVVADPNRQAPQPHAGSRAVRLHAPGGRRPETRYIWWVIFRQRVSADRYGVPHLKSSGPVRASRRCAGANRFGLSLAAKAQIVLRYRQAVRPVRLPKAVCHL